MSMYAPIFKVCAASTAVTALLGTSPVRLWPFGEAPEGTPTPYVVWQGIGGNPENYINQRPDIDSFDLQVDVYADTATAARNVAEALSNAVEPHAHITSWRGERRDRDTKRYRFSFDLEWFVER